MRLLPAEQRTGQNVNSKLETTINISCAHNKFNEIKFPFEFGVTATSEKSWIFHIHWQQTKKPDMQ